MGFSEPLSFLQRLTEDLEYADCLDAAAALGDADSCLRLAYVTAFAVSGYANTTDRLARPFNPLLGETFDCNRMADLGWKSIAEKVRLRSHFQFFCAGRNRNVTVWCSSVRPSVCLSRLFLTLIGRAAHSQCGSPGGSTQIGQRTFPSEYYEDGHTCYASGKRNVTV